MKSVSTMTIIVKDKLFTLKMERGKFAIAVTMC